MTREVWLRSHPYLKTFADFHAQVETVLVSLPIPGAVVPHWDNYEGDFRDGVPLLHSARVEINLRPVETTVASLVETLAAKPLPHPLAEETRALAAQLLREQDAPHRAVAWLIHSDPFVPAQPGLLRYLGWTALMRFLYPVVGGFASWRDEQYWLRSFCPTCGSLPAMAHLVGADPGRLRLLSCGCCGTRWRFRRTGCPFCENQDDHRLTAWSIEGEAGMRIDYCEHCRGYLKTYGGSGDEAFLLEDWTSLHLDIIARNHGLKRLAASLYQV